MTQLGWSTLAETELCVVVAGIAISAQNTILIRKTNNSCQER